MKYLIFDRSGRPPGCVFFGAAAWRKAGTITSAGLPSSGEKINAMLPCNLKNNFIA